MEVSTRQKLTGGDLAVFTEIEVPKTVRCLQETIESMVDDEGAVEVEADLNDYGATFTVKCAAPDLGKVIGKQGRIARSLRTILTAKAAKLGVSYTLNIDEGGI